MERGRKWIFGLCWITYVFAYLCRVNLSSALLKLESVYHVTSGTLGFIGSLFFITYAVGQLVNGFIGDRVSPYRFLFLALSGTALLNLLISVSGHFYMLAVCWALNGYVQSMFWGPLMRILSMHFPKERHVNVSTGMTISMVAGFILSWAVLGRALLKAKWNLYFLIPAVCAFTVLLAWAAFSTRAKRQPLSETQNRTLPPARLMRTVVEQKLFVPALICICMGLIKESVSLWAPVILIKALRFEAGSALIFILFIPLANLGGIFFARRLVKRYAGKIRKALLFLFLAVAACSAGVFVFSGISKIACLLLIACISAVTFGCNSILLSVIPLSFARYNIVSTLVGIFDFCSYAGAAVSAFALGLILTGEQWKAILFVWLAAAVLAMALSLLYRPNPKEAAENG